MSQSPLGTSDKRKDLAAMFHFTQKFCKVCVSREFVNNKKVAIQNELALFCIILIASLLEERDKRCKPFSLSDSVISFHRNTCK